jgi:8-oxo-dGTP pyrophosphatase MutT (NUDIX family)
MANGNGVPEKVAWILVRNNRVLVTRSHGRDRFYFPGGHREPGESDGDTLVREIDEELQTAIDPGSMAQFGIFEIGEGHPDHDPFRMICYTADHRGELIPSREIAEKAWFCYGDRHRVSAVDALAFDALHESGGLSSSRDRCHGSEVPRSVRPRPNRRRRQWPTEQPRNRSSRAPSAPSDRASVVP